MTRRRHAARRLRWWLPAGLVVLVAATAVVLVLLAAHHVTPPRAEAAATGPPAPRVVDRAPARTAPRHLWIPSLHVSVPLVRLGLNHDRSVQVPRDPDDAGWYRLGTVPGERGSAVVLGHVDSDAGPAVFARLASLRTGDRVRVESGDGRRLRFAVTSVRTYANADFPARQVYAPGGTARRLTLVTCGGGYDARTGYLGNVVVSATLLTPTR